MNVIALVIIIAIIGVILYAINAFLPIDARLKTLIYVIVVLVLLLWLLQQFGGGSGFGNFNCGRVR